MNAVRKLAECQDYPGHTLSDGRCGPCSWGVPLLLYGGVVGHLNTAWDNKVVRCLDWDTENRHADEAIGFYTFSWLPKKCRNGKVRWLRWLERHADSTFTLGDRVPHVKACCPR